MVEGEGVESRPEEYPQSEAGDKGTFMLIGEILDDSMVWSLVPRWDMRREPTAMSTPVEARHLLTSVAQVV